MAAVRQEMPMLLLSISPVSWTSRLLKQSGVLREDDGQNALAHAMAASADMSLIPEATRDD
jgi:hypothetical protein